MTHAKTIRSLSVGVLLTIPLAIYSFQTPATQLAPYAETLPNSAVKINMVPIPGGSIKIGGQDVKVKPFYMATTETTWEAFDVFLASGDPSKPYEQKEFPPDAVARPSRSYILPDLGWGHHGYPAINLSFINVEMFCRWLSAATKKKYRVPTEAEWELAARGGSNADFKLDDVEKHSWHEGNSAETTHPVGTKAPNKFGLYDMYGNVGEWATDLKGKPVLCGPTFRDNAKAITPSERKYWEAKWQEEDPQIPKSRWWLSDAPFAGFRIVCEG
jgi:formylglycine-generating enzyme required for sulfatase activity